MISDQLIHELEVLQDGDIPGCFYDSDEEFIRVMSAYIGMAVKDGHKILALVNPKEVLNVEGLIKSCTSDTLQGPETSQAFIIHDNEDGRDSDVLADMLQEIRIALNNGWPGARISIDMKTLMETMPADIGVHNCINLIKTLNGH